MAPIEPDYSRAKPIVGSILRRASGSLAPFPRDSWGWQHGVFSACRIGIGKGVLGLDLSITLLDRSDEVDATSLREKFTQHVNLVLSGMKSFADGTLGSRTAWMDTLGRTYALDGWPLDHTAEGTLAAWARQVRAEALDPAVHAIGSAAVAAVLDAFESAGIVSGRVEHAQFVRDVDLPRFQGHWCSMQPTHHVDDAREIAKCADPALAFRFRSLHEAGGQLPSPAIGSSSKPIPFMQCLKPFDRTV